MAARTQGWALRATGTLARFVIWAEFCPRNRVAVAWDTEAYLLFERKADAAAVAARLRVPCEVLRVRRDANGRTSLRVAVPCSKTPSPRNKVREQPPLAVARRNS